MPFRATELSVKHEAEIALTVRRSLAQWLKGADERPPREVVSALERVLVFLRQNGQPNAAVSARHRAGALIRRTGRA